MCPVKTLQFLSLVSDLSQGVLVSVSALHGLPTRAFKREAASTSCDTVGDPVARNSYDLTVCLILNGLLVIVYPESFTVGDFLHIQLFDPI